MIKELEQFAKDHPDFEVWFDDKLSDDRQDSNWYDGNVFNYTYRNRFIVCVFATGDVKITLKGDDNSYHRLQDTDLKTDEDLKEIEEWLNNNWFSLYIYDTKQDQYINDNDDEVIDNITDAIDLKFIQGLIDEHLEGDF